MDIPSWFHLMSALTNMTVLLYCTGIVKLTHDMTCVFFHFILLNLSPKQLVATLGVMIGSTLIFIGFVHIDPFVGYVALGSIILTYFCYFFDVRCV